MKTLVCTLLIAAITYQVSAQEQERKNAVFTELGGNGLAFSLNYERQLTKKPALHIRAGVGLIPPTFEPAVLLIPVSINYLLRIGRKNFLEFGLGDTFMPKVEVSDCPLFNLGGTPCTRETESLNLLMASVGYRKNFGKRQNWLWRVNFTPTVGTSFKGSSALDLQPWAGISIGKRF